jgi:hypothetical protein
VSFGNAEATFFRASSPTSFSFNFSVFRSRGWSIRIPAGPSSTKTTCNPPPNGWINMRFSAAFSGNRAFKVRCVDCTHASSFSTSLTAEGTSTASDKSPACTATEMSNEVTAKKAHRFSSRPRASA